MLFISAVFIVVFLPVAVSGFYIIQRRFGRTFALAWLVAASFTFYATWNPYDLPILLGLIAANFILGGLIARTEGTPRRLWLIGALTFNLLVLGYFKYANFFADNLAQLFGWPLSTGSRTAGLPLGISFIAFQKIAYLVDVYQKKIKPAGIFDFSVFASFFPQLVAGPIVHYREIGPQLLREEKNPPVAERLSIGVTIFAIGLFKKIVLADSISPFANNIFNAAGDGATLTFFEAWLGTLCYGLQIYFDFSGYSDMAIGIARMFGIKMPVNFFSPYRARNVIEFWRRWHITLSRFLRDYLYIPLGGNRRGRARHFLNLTITMTLGGLWHGASWNFILWGVLHGFYLAVNHAWLMIRPQAKMRDRSRGIAWFSGALTFILVTIAWVPFRANTIATTISIWKSMAGLNGISLPKAWAAYAAYMPWLTDLGLRFEGAHSGNLFAANQLMPVLLGGLAIVFFAPNATQFMAHYRPVLDFNGLVGKPTHWAPRWQPNLIWALFTMMLLIIAILAPLQSSDFIYYQF